MQSIKDMKLNMAQSSNGGAHKESMAHYGEGEKYNVICALRDT